MSWRGGLKLDPNIIDLVRGDNGMTDKKDSLAHYGVIGMKWGIRRYQNKDGSLTSDGKSRYRYESWTTKHHDKAAKKAEDRGNMVKAEKHQKLANRSRELDRREQEYAQRVGTGKNLLTRWLTGDAIGGKGYQQMLSILGGQNESGVTGKKVAAMFLQNRILGKQIAIRIDGLLDHEEE